MKLSAKHHKRKNCAVMEAFNRRLNSGVRYEPWYGKAKETHLCKHCTQIYFYHRVDELLIEKLSAGKAFKVNIFLGYTLVDKNSGVERFFSPQYNTRAFNRPTPINRVSDIGKGIELYQRHVFY